MGKKIKILSGVLGVAMLFSCIAGCKGGSETPGGSQEGTPLSSMGEVEGTIHEYNIGTTAYDIVADGKSDYVIVSRDGIASGGDESAAISDLRYFFGQATGIDLPVVSESEVAWSAGAVYISVGQTSLAEAAGVRATEEDVGTAGFRIVTEGRSIFALGATEVGTANAVFELMHQLIGFEPYGVYTTALDENVTDLALPDFDIRDVPDIPLFMNSYGVYNVSPELRRRQRVTNSMWISAGATYHNSFYYLPKAEWELSHPGWYATGAEQLCYTAHGDAEELDLMIDAVVEAMKEYLIGNPDGEYITFTQQDNVGWCSCEACQAVLQKYGANSASVIQFVNEVSARIREWFAGEGAEYERPLEICFFAYHSTNDAPVVSENGTYRPVDESVVCDEGVSVIFAPIGMDYHYAFTDPVNRASYEAINGWSAVSSKLFMWTYCTNFSYYLAPFNSFGAMQDSYRFLKEMSTFYLYDQSQYNNSNCTGFTNLKMYLSAKLAWNVNLNVEELIDNYFENCYGLANAAMRKYFEGLRSQFAYMENVVGIGGSIYENTITTANYPKPVLTAWLDYIDEAYAAIEPLKESDPAAYDNIYKNILTESISVRYILLTLYSSKYVESELEEMESSFIRDLGTVNITYVSEHVTVDGLF